MKHIKKFENFNSDISWEDAKDISDKVDLEKKEEMKQKTIEYWSRPDSTEAIIDAMRKGEPGEEHHISGEISMLGGFDKLRKLDWKGRLNMYHSLWSSNPKNKGKKAQWPTLAELGEK